MESQPRTVPLEALHLSAFPVTLAAAPEGGKKRTFTGIANSGKPMSNWFWDRFVIDLDDVNLSAGSTPGLIDHDFSRRAAAGRLMVEEGNLLVAGNLLSNEHGQAVANDADEGFPWQMSVYVEPGSIEKFESGTDVMVNGQTLTGPIAVFRNSRFHEFSFTPIGVDTDTRARILSRGENQQSIEIQEVKHMAETPSAGNDNTLTIEQLQAQVTGFQQQLSALTLSRDKETARADETASALEKLRTEQREKDVKALLSAKGVEYSETVARPYLDMAQEVFDAVQAEATALLSSDNQANQQLRPEFFHSDNSGHGAGTALNQGENPLFTDARARAKAAA